ncbi:hypothetical protein MUN89_09105 [Halobacillus salinarum]|uniref:Holin n=1 Tax=Halobacillus salinarum TaxID=2932257 RepID=A0ABY4EQU6_9BACI|nr:hypothetical protein [Halobacillus salinarum]UOQ46052.1 hypothetical protein MUN89_09105 [Halobacillus salinarum]
MKNFFIQSLSADESRISAIIIGFFITLLFAMYQYVSTGSIDENAKNLLTTFVYVIGGVHVSQHVKDYVLTRNQAGAFKSKSSEIDK